MPESPLAGWFIRLSRALAREGVRHALAGGLALAVRGRARATLDIDLVLAGGEDMIERTRRVCREAGLLQAGRSVVSFKKLRLLRMLIPPEGGPEPISVDFLLLDPAFEADVLARCTPALVGGTEVPVVSAEDLILLKLNRASLQDLADIEAITTSTHQLDRAYLARQAKKLGVTHRLDKALGRAR